MPKKFKRIIRIAFVLTVLYWIFLSGHSLTEFPLIELIIVVVIAFVIAFMYVDDTSPPRKFEGNISDLETNRKCPVCRGSGRATVQDVSLDGLRYEREERCENCRGRGTL